MSSYPTRNRELQKNSKKKFKNTILASFLAKLRWEWPRKNLNKGKSFR